LLRAGFVLFFLFIAAGLLRSLATQQRLPGVGVEYTSALRTMIEEQGTAASLPLIRSAAQIDFDNEMAVTLWLQSAREADERDEVLRALSALVRLKPEDAAVRTELAAELLAQGRAPEAFTHASFAAWLAPSSPAALAALGDALRLLGQNEQAAAAYQRALAIDPATEAAQAGIRLLSNYGS
jgi:tetratricopeptide (TPR) repeat protein